MNYHAQKRHGGTLHVYWYAKEVSLENLYTNQYLTLWRRQNYKYNKKVRNYHGQKIGHF